MNELEPEEHQWEWLLCDLTQLELLPCSEFLRAATQAPYSRSEFERAGGLEEKVGCGVVLHAGTCGLASSHAHRLCKLSNGTFMPMPSCPGTRNAASGYQAFPGFQPRRFFFTRT